MKYSDYDRDGVAALIEQEAEQRLAQRLADERKGCTVYTVLSDERLAHAINEAVRRGYETGWNDCQREFLKEEQRHAAGRMMTVSEVAELTGKNKDTIRRWGRLGLHGAHNVGGSYMFRYSDIEGE